MNPTHLKKKLASIIVVASLFLVGHYYVLSTQVEMFREVRLVCVSALLGLCTFGAVFLLTDSRGMRSRKIFALEMLLVALAAGITLLRVFSAGEAYVPSSCIISCGVMIYGNMFAFIILMYPFERLSYRPMNLWGYFKLFLPALLPGLIFYGYVSLSKTPMTELSNWHDLFANLHRFDVWFRFAILVYPIWMFILIIRRKKCYVAWCRKNLSNMKYVDMGWLDYYLFGYFLIMVSYMIVVLQNNHQSLIMHGVGFLVFFGFAFINILRQPAPDLSVLSCGGQDCNSETISQNSCAGEECKEASANDTKYRFVDKISEYKIELEKWMHEQKPYSNKDFKLLDVMQVLPLNRSYISRLFNEGYGESFFDFVMRYRIDESIRLLENHPEMNIRRISDVCGFSSPSVFGRAFLKNKGITPKQYRRESSIL